MGVSQTAAAPALEDVIATTATTAVSYTVIVLYMDPTTHTNRTPRYIDCMFHIGYVFYPCGALFPPLSLLFIPKIYEICLYFETFFRTGLLEGATWRTITWTLLI
jgi:hypothetical protein